MGQFSSACPINKAVPSFINSLTRARKRRWKTVQAFLSTQKSVRTYCVCVVLKVETIFDTVSPAKFPCLKAE